MDRLTSMDVFLKVADEGGFTAAARRLMLSKSVVSKHVQALEKHLGVRLFHRTTRRLSLTEAGVRYYERCARIIEEVAEAERSVSSLHAQPRGVLRVNVPVSFGLLHLSHALPDFTARYPDLSLDVTLNDRFVDLVNEGYDVALRITELRDSSLIARRIAPAEGWLCASPGYLSRRGEPAHPAALTEHECLIYTYGRQLHEWRLRDRAGREHRVPVRSNLRANSGEFLLAAAERGSGIIFVPDFIAWESVRDGRLVRLLPGYAGPPLGIYAVYPYTRHVSAKVRAFVDFLAERFGGDGAVWRDVATPISQA